jgi:serine/threonine protein phosphatase PrpC
MIAKGDQSDRQIVEKVLDDILAPETSNGVGCDNMTCILIRFNN